MSSVVFAKDTSNHDQQMKEIIEKSKHDAQELIDNWDNLKVVSTPDAIAEANGISKNATAKPQISPRSSVSVGSEGNILVTPSSIPQGGSITGHAAMVSWNNDVTIESEPNGGVQRKTNDWKTRYPKALCARVSGGNTFDAVQTASNHVGKGYNYNFWNKWTTDKFYCSQLVWRAYLDQGIDLDKDGGNAVLPTDLISDKIEIIWRNNY